VKFIQEYLDTCDQSDNGTTLSVPNFLIGKISVLELNQKKFGRKLVKPNTNDELGLYKNMFKFWTNYKNKKLRDNKRKRLAYNATYSMFRNRGYGNREATLKTNAIFK